MSIHASESAAEAPTVLAKAAMNAARGLGLTQSELGEVIGRDRSSLRRGLDPASKAGELALLLIRGYRSLFVLVGGEAADMRHWMQTENLSGLRISVSPMVAMEM